MRKETQLEYNSEFLNDVMVVVVFNDDPLYSQVKVFFEQYGFGFMAPGQNLMIIDGEILAGEPDAKDILKFIEAHEVTHIILGHDGPRNEKDEIEADLVATKYPLASAAFFFDSNKLWSICDRGDDDATVTAVTRRVNGGTIGLDDRIKHFKEYYNLLK
jgi:hypothetical protein